MRNKLFNDVINMGKSAGFDEKHALNVNIIALKLFDQLQDLHRMGNTERLWLEIAALLHDIGKHQNREVHNKLARDMIAGISFMPFGKRERKIIGLIARYHRGCLPSQKHKYFRKLDAESRMYVVKLASILRIADGLVSRKSMITDLICDIEDSTIRVDLKCNKYIPVGKAIKKADFFKHFFGKSLILNMQIAHDSAEKAFAIN